MRTIISGLALGGAIAAASATMAGACQFHQTMATNDQTPPSQVAQGDAPALTNWNGRVVGGLRAAEGLADA